MGGPNARRLSGAAFGKGRGGDEAVKESFIDGDVENVREGKELFEGDGSDAAFDVRHDGAGEAQGSGERLLGLETVEAKTADVPADDRGDGVGSDHGKKF